MVGADLGLVAWCCSGVEGEVLADWKVGGRAEGMEGLEGEQGPSGHAE